MSVFGANFFTFAIGVIWACFALGKVALAQAETTVYRGVCDGSAGVALDESHFAVADDEKNILRIYKISAADEVGRADIVAFLDTKKKKNKDEFKESDIEGAARIGDRVYWIGSHSRNSSGEADSNRSRFFATDISPGPNLRSVGKTPYKNLLADILAEPKFAGLGRAAASGGEAEKDGPKPESENGFNIEGLAADATGRLLIGLRNPRPKGKAVLLPLTNPAQVIDAGAKPVFDAPIELDLEGRGIRSVEGVGDRVIILAGPHGKAKEAIVKPEFRLFEWNGAQGGEKPLPVAVETIEGMGPEGLFALPGGKEIMLLYDEGDRKVTDKKDCKDAGEKSFRAVRLRLP